MSHLPSPPRVAVFSTKGTNSNEEDRIKALLTSFDPAVLPFDKRAKLAGLCNVFSAVRRNRPDLLVMEGTGLAGGLVCLAARVLLGTHYVFSSGDAVGPFVASHARGLGLPFALYERLLCRLSSGFIGWTPYLVGRALTMGAPKGVTAAGWAPFVKTPEALEAARLNMRQALNIPAEAFVVGIVGSLVWNRRVGYCYGYELVRAMANVRRPDIVALIVGGGSGLERLRALAGKMLGTRILLPGPVSQDRAIDHMAAMDVGSLPQSVDGVGSFRYTTKLSEYLAARLPIVTSQIPMAYDIAADWSWRLPGKVPWGLQYISEMSGWMDSLTADELAAKRPPANAAIFDFNFSRQVRQVTIFIQDLLQQSHLDRL